MPENQTGNVESDALAEIERRCRFLAPTTPMAAVLAIVRDVLTRVTPPAECDHLYPPANRDGTCPSCGKPRVVPPAEGREAQPC